MFKNQFPAAAGFDVFDTCISRMHAHPRDLFFDVGLKLAPSGLDAASKNRFARRFQRARIRAEKIANWRAKPHSENADIYEIYKNLRWVMRLDRPVSELVAAELAAEEESTYPIPSRLKHIEQLRNERSKIIFISDMYIPSRFLCQLLANKGVMKEGDTLYVSCDHGKTKHSGRLFQHVLKLEGLEAQDLKHFGDNFHADILMAKAHGIDATHTPSACLNKFEILIAGLKLPRDRGRAWIAAFSRRCRLVAPETRGQNDAQEEVVFGVIVPFLISYVLWVLDHAVRNGIKRLYFVARDGEVLYKIAKELNAPESFLDLRYLHGSRRAWLAPSITSDSKEWSRLVVVAGNTNSAFDICKRVGLDDASQNSVRAILGIEEAQWHRDLGPRGGRSFCSELISNHQTSKIIESSVNTRLQIALAYFSQEGLLDGEKWALVDAGWSLNSQCALKRVLNSVSPGTPVSGYYIGLSRDHLSESQAGAFHSFVPGSGSLFSRRRVIIEHCFMPGTHASTIDYIKSSGEIVPVLGEETRTPSELAYAQRLHEVAVSSARLVATESDIRKKLSGYTDRILENAERFIKHPSGEHARSLANFGTITDMRHDQAHLEQLCRPLKMSDVWQTIVMTLSKHRSFVSSGYMWLEGSVAISPLHVRLPLKMLLLGDSIKNRLLYRK